VPTSFTKDGNLGMYAVYSDRIPGDYYLFDRSAKKATYVVSRNSWFTPEMLNPVYERGLSELDESLCQRWIDLDIARQVFYGDCDDELAQSARDRLRPQSVSPALAPCSLAEHPTVPTTYIVCKDDQMLRPEWSRWAVRERLTAELVELPGGHSPFYSRPAELAAVLLGLV